MPPAPSSREKSDFLSTSLQIYFPIVTEWTIQSIILRQFTVLLYEQVKSLTSLSRKKKIFTFQQQSAIAFFFLMTLSALIV